MKKESTPNNLDFKTMINSDFNSFKGSSKKIKNDLTKNDKFNNYFDSKQKVKKAFILPLLGFIPGSLMKIAAVGFIFLASYTSLKITVQQPGYNIEKLQVVDSSYNGFDTCMVNTMVIGM